MKDRRGSAAVLAVVPLVVLGSVLFLVLPALDGGTERACGRVTDLRHGRGDAPEAYVALDGTRHPLGSNAAAEYESLSRWVGGGTVCVDVDARTGEVVRVHE